MAPHVCPWWGGYFIDNRFRRLLHNPEKILAPHIQSGMTVMDFGCGMGVFAIPMARLVGERGRVIAVDLQQRMLDVLHKRAVQAGLAGRIDTHRCQSDSLEMSEMVDFALAFYSAHEVPNPRRLFNDLYNVLNHGSKLLVVEPVGHVTTSDLQETIGLAESLGFQVRGHPRIRWSHSVLMMKE